VTGLDVALAPAARGRSSFDEPPAVAQFDVYRHSYSDEVRKSVAFIGQELDFFSEVKARYLLEVGERQLGRLTDRTALDVGCGIGLTHKFLASRFASLHGIDVSDEMVCRAAELNPTVKYQSYDGRALPYADQAFDLLFAINVLHHVPPTCRREFAREMARVTKANGLVVIFEHNPLNPLTRLAVRRCRFDLDCTLLLPATVEALLSGNGLVPTIARHILFFPWRGQVFASLDRRLGLIPLGAQYFVAARPS
jgi:SAM-dependent methyltransferase